MIVANYDEFRSNFKKYLDLVEEDHETLVIKRKTGKGVVMVSFEEYKSIMETLHLLSSRKNANRLYESMDQVRARKPKQIQQKV